MKVKRLFAGLLSAVMLMTLLPVGASAADSDVIGVFQGPDIYVTVRPFTISEPGYELNADSHVYYQGFYEGLYAKTGPADTRHGVRIGYFNTDGELQAESWVLSTYAANVSEERASVSDDRIVFWDGESSTSEDLGLPESNEVLYGYMDTHGNVVIEPQYFADEINAFHDGYAYLDVYTNQDDTGETGRLIDADGNTVMTFKYGRTRAQNYINHSDGIVCYRESDRDMVEIWEEKVVYADIETGDVIMEFDMLEDADGYLSDRLIPRINNTYSPFSEGYLVCLDYRGVSAETLAYHEQEERYVIFDRSGNEVGTLPEGVWPGGDIGFHGGLLMIRGEVNQTGFSAIGGAVNTQGELVFEPGSLGYRPSECGLAVLSAGAGSDTVDFDGNVVIPRDATLPNGLRLEVVHPTPSELPYFSDDGIALGATRGDNGFVNAYYVLEAHDGVYSGSAPILYGAENVTPTDPETPTEPTGDTPSSWAVENVNTAVDAGIVPETLQSAYTQATTRAEFCALAVELYETIMGTEITERATFSDTTDVNVEKMAGLGVVNGVGDGKFDPSASLTREEAATMLSRLANVMEKPLTAGTASFADNASISSWASEAVGQVQASGIMNGIEGNQFAPSDPYTREQSIVTMLRLYDFVK